MSVGSLTSQQVKKAARTIDSLLTDTKTLNMAKSSAYFMLYKDGDYYYAMTTDGTTKQLASNKTLTVKFLDQGSSSYTDVADTPIVISYDKASGAFRERGTKAEGAEPEFTTGEYVKEIIVSAGNRERKIVLYPRTGKHEVK